MRFGILIILCTALIPFLSAATQTGKGVVVHVGSSLENSAQRYYVDLLAFVLERTKSDFVYSHIIPRQVISTRHKRALILMQQGQLDLIWSGVEEARERDMQRVNFSLFGGLLGYRVSIVRKQDHVEFAQLSKTSWQQKKACLKTEWIDSDILQDNAFSVLRVVENGIIFKLLNDGHCDYFPRSIYEGYFELQQARDKYPTLAMFDQVFLRYDLPMFYYVAKGNHALAQQIESGLMKARENGDLIIFMQNHPVTAHLFPLGKWQHKRVIHLHNKNIPTNMDLVKTNWFNLMVN